VARLRGLIVHQHGCGSGACKGGQTAAYDLHWQALARKWHCALLGPSYEQKDNQDCWLWYDPRKGSARTFLRALDDLARQSHHPELATVPWCLWGHSGGGFWASLTQTLYPERIAAIWLRSGTAFGYWEKGEVARPKISAAVYGIPVMCNPGHKEKNDGVFGRIWTGIFAMFQTYRARGAPIGFAPDPRTSHECGDSRYLAIPFFDACLALRLPVEGATKQKLKRIAMKAGWLARPLTDKPVPARSYQGKVDEAVWLPDERVARAWAEYVRTGAVGDTTPPPPPFHVRATAGDNGIELTWDADADLQSGIRAFVTQRDGKELAQVPARPIGRFGRPLFQTMSYHETPEKPLPAMRFVDSTARPGSKHQYWIIQVNSAGCKSKPSWSATAR